MKNLAGKRILLSGCGAVGGFLAQQLAQIGAGAPGGKLMLVDDDTLQGANLGRLSSARLISPGTRPKPVPISLASSFLTWTSEAVRRRSRSRWTYALITHCMPVKPACNDRPTLGSATATIFESSMISEGTSEAVSSTANLEVRSSRAVMRHSAGVPQRDNIAAPPADRTCRNRAQCVPAGDAHRAGAPRALRTPPRRLSTSTSSSR